MKPPIRLYPAVLACLMAAAPASRADVVIDVDKTGEPISEYVFGQFIEHLGRCIYGGIWAEMLEDRKFYYPVTPEFEPWDTATDNSFWRGGDFPVLTGSPWRMTGGADSVRMSEDDPYTGEHAPELVPSGDGPAGIEQGELALIEGKTYTGYAILSGRAGAKAEASLIWGGGPDDSQSRAIELTGEGYGRYSFEFEAGASTSHGRLRIEASGGGTVRVGAVSLMPADNVHGFRKDTLALMRDLDSPVYRWPGGNFVSGYDWRDGVGDRDKRPPRKNPAWTGIESNDVGMHEFIQLCRLLDTEPFIAVNTGLGTPGEAAEQVEYCNGAADTPMGAMRAANGHPEPFGVTFWAVGNEMYGDWQLGHMPLGEYVKKHNRCAELMYAKDPSIELIAVGNAGEWSEAMMTHCADHMDLISEHIYRKSDDNLAEHVALIPEAIRRVAEAHREYRREIEGLTEKDIRIAMDEWNYWYGPYVYGELGVQYHLQDALGIAAGLHEYFRNSDLYFMANYAQTVNVIGAIKTSKTAASMETTGLALQLYRHHYGVVPVETAGVPEPLDIAAALSADGKTLTVGVVNPTHEPREVEFAIEGREAAGPVTVRFIAGEDKMAHNKPGEEPAVRIETETLDAAPAALSVKPISATLFEIPLR